MDNNPQQYLPSQNPQSNDWAWLQSLSFKDYLMLALIFVFGVNSLVLDLAPLLFKSRPQTAQPTTLQTSTQPLTCPQSCVSFFNSAAATLVSSPGAKIVSIPTPTLTPKPTLTPTPTSTPIPTPTPTPIPLTKEFFIPLGNGSGDYGTWTTIPGIEATIDTTNYAPIKNAYFEITVDIPTGNQTVSVRLYNATTYQTVDNSTLILSGGTPTLLTAPISLESGKNTYQVQLQTQLKYTTYISQARIRIDTQ